MSGLERCVLVIETRKYIFQDPYKNIFSEKNAFLNTLRTLQLHDCQVPKFNDWILEDLDQFEWKRIIQIGYICISL